MLLVAPEHARPLPRSRAPPPCGGARRARCARPAAPRAPGCTTAGPAAPCSSGVPRSGACRHRCRSWSRPPPHSTGSAPSARFETAVLADGEVARGHARGQPVPARLRAIPTFGTKALNRLARAGRRHRVSSEIDGRVFGDESFFDSRRGGPASGFGISPYVGPLSALAFNRGSLLPFARGWQTQSRRRSPRSACACRCGARTSRRRGRPRTADAPADATDGRCGRPHRRCEASCATRTRCRTTTTPRCC